LEILGDPLALFTGVGSGVVDFLRTTHAELVGDTNSRGKGVRILANAVVGSTFASASKVSGTLADIVKASISTLFD